MAGFSLTFLNAHRMKYFAFFLGIMIRAGLSAQGCGDLNLTHQADIASTCNQMVMTMMHDQNDRPYLYVANKEAGLKIYQITDVNNPLAVATVPTTQYGGLHVMNLTQQGNYLYLALGDFFANSSGAGMAIIDVTTPESPVMTDYYVVPDAETGAGIVQIEDHYAYLGAMRSGLVILDVFDKNNIQFVSQYIPPIDFPPVPNPTPGFYNARGLAVQNGVVYLCYDAGGVRVINCVDKSSPIETGRWCNPAMYTPFDHPKAYNNIVLDDSLAYVAVDYAGMEVLHIADTANIQLMGWWNPYNAPAANWFTCNIHTNEIVFDSVCQSVFLSSGKSDLHVIDVSDPSLPDSCDFYGGVGNNIGTWGVSRWKNQVYVSYVCALIPFASNWTGVKLLTYDTCFSQSGIYDAAEKASELTLGPNPFVECFRVHSDNSFDEATWRLYDAMGKLIDEKYPIEGRQFEVRVPGLKAGIYILQVLETGRPIATKKLMLIDR